MYINPYEDCTYLQVLLKKCMKLIKITSILHNHYLLKITDKFFSKFLIVTLLRDTLINEDRFYQNISCVQQFAIFYFFKTLKELFIIEYFT